MSMDDNPYMAPVSDPSAGDNNLFMSQPPPPPQQSIQDLIAQTNKWLAAQGLAQNAFSLNPGDTLHQFDPSGSGLGYYNFGNGVSAYVPTTDPRFIPRPQENAGLFSGGLSDDLSQASGGLGVMAAALGGALFSGAGAAATVGTDSTMTLSEQIAAQQAAGAAGSSASSAAAAGTASPTFTGADAALGNDPSIAGASGGNTSAGGVAGTTGTTNMASTGYFDDFTGQWVDTPAGDPNATGAFDQFGSMSNPSAAGAPTFDGADAALGNQVGADNSTIFGGTASDPFGTGSSSSLSLSDLKNAISAYKLFSAGGLPGGVGGLLGAAGGGGLFDTGGLGATAARTAPGLAALAYAAAQPGIDTGQLNAILGRLGGNQDAVVKAATDPVNANIAAGYGDLVQSQALRGIRGSSFGDTDIGNYIATTGNTLANAGANAAEGSLALQGNLAGNIATLRAQSQKMKNDLYGRAFDVLGRGLNPGGYAGTTNIYTGAGAPGVGAQGPKPATPGGLNLSSLSRLLPLATSAFNYATA